MREVVEQILEMTDLANQRPTKVVCNVKLKPVGLNAVFSTLPVPNWERGELPVSIRR